MANKNLLQETLEDLKGNHKTPEDVLFVADNKNFCSWAQFEEVAKDYYYDNGFGGPEVNMGLVIVGDNWWLERYEYDGSEWWEYKEKPTIANKELTQNLCLCSDPDWWYQD